MEQPPQVFISYGRADALDFAKRLAGDLQLRACYRVFLDLESMDKGGLWEARIERGIKESSFLLAVMSRHALRVESVCRDEVVYALCEGKPIVPLRQDPDPLLRPPLLLARRNWIDFTADYEQGFQALLKFIKGDNSVLRPPALPTITGVVPLDFGAEIARFTHDFTGREWVQREIDRWLARDGRRAMVIVGEPGVGKSAIAAWLSQTRPDVIGIHFCTQQNSRTRDPYEFVASLVSHLHASLAGFAEAVEARHPEVRRPDGKAAFRELIIEPARSLPSPAHPCLIVVDSLDESFVQPNESVLDVLVNMVKDLPTWLRVIATTRPVQPVLHRIRALKVFELLADHPDNRPDLRRYITARLETPTLCRLVGAEAVAITARLEGLSEGNFLYGRLALDAMEEGSLGLADLGHLSVGLGDFYTGAFTREFPDTQAYYREIAPLVSALAVAHGPMPFGLLCRAAGESPTIVNLRLNRLRCWLKVQGQNEGATYMLFHKSLQDWLCNRDESGNYWCDTHAGQSRLVELLKDVWATDDYALRYLPAHLVALERWDDLCTLLCDLCFIEARCAAGQVFELQADYRLALSGLPEMQAESKARRAREARLDCWTRDIVSYALTSSRRRDQLARGEGATAPEPKLPEVVNSGHNCSNEEIERACERMRYLPDRSEQLRAFAGFVTAHYYPLFRHGRSPGFVLQHAFNCEPSGPVHQAAVKLIQDYKKPWIERCWGPEARYVPKPACLRTIEGHCARIYSVSVTTDCRRAISASLDKTLRVWDLEDGACLWNLEGHSDAVRSVSMTPNGLRAVSASDDRTLRVWDLESGGCLHRLEGHEGAVLSVSVTPDGRRAVSASDDQTLRIWDLEKGICVRTLRGHSSAVISVTGTPDGCRALSGGCDSTLRVWDLETGTCVLTLKGHRAWVLCVSMTPDGRLALSGSDDRALRLWNLESGACLQALDGHSAGVSSVSVTPDGRYAVSASQDRTVRLWDLKTANCVRILRGHSHDVLSVSLTPDGRRAVSAGRDRTVRIWDLETGVNIPPPRRHSLAVRSVSMTPDGSRAVSVSDDLTLRVWDVERARCLASMSGHRLGVRSVNVTPDGGRAISAGRDRTLRVWDLDRSACLQICRGHADGVFGVSVMPGGQRAVSASLDHTLRLWDIATGACLRVLEGHTDAVLSTSVTSNGRLIISASSDNTLRVWDLARGVCLRTLAGHKNAVCSVCVAPDGRRAVSASFDRTLRIWELQTGVCLRILEGHDDRVLCVSLTEGGKWAVSASVDRTLRVWNLETGTCTLMVHTQSSPFSVSLSARNRLVYGTESGEVVFLKMHGFIA